MATPGARGAPDDTTTYYLAVVDALETVTAQSVGISEQERSRRRAAWEEAYRRTPHGQPVKLSD